jgi:hypothetical protein
MDQSMDIYFGNWRENLNCINVDRGFSRVQSIFMAIEDGIKLFWAKHF